MRFLKRSKRETEARPPDRPSVHPLVFGVLESVAWGGRDQEAWGVAAAAGQPRALRATEIVAALLVPARCCSAAYTGADGDRVVLDEARSLADGYVTSRGLPSIVDLLEVGDRVERIHAKHKAEFDDAHAAYQRLGSDGKYEEQGKVDLRTPSANIEAARTTLRPLGAMAFIADAEASWAPRSKEGLHNVYRFSGQDAGRTVQDEPQRAIELVSELAALTHEPRV